MHKVIADKIEGVSLRYYPSSKEFIVRDDVTKEAYHTTRSLDEGQRLFEAIRKDFRDARAEGRVLPRDARREENRIAREKTRRITAEMLEHDKAMFEKRMAEDVWEASPKTTNDDGSSRE
jgi:hypothetical protein